MEKIRFTFDEDEETEEFFVLEQTKINETTYLLVSDSFDDDGECMILKEVGTSQDDNIYEIVEENEELLAVSKVFEELLEDTDIEL